MTFIAPSLLACDFSRIEEEVARCVEAGADGLHLDFMDGHFVPNLSFGFPVMEAVAKRFPQLKLDVHLMVSNPQDYLERLVEIGVFQISVHWEACLHLHRTLSEIRALGIRAGVAFNPHTPIEGVANVMDLVDCLLIMTVNPGFGGQSFLHSQLPKIRTARSLADSTGRDVFVGVDGGVDDQTASRCLDAGADLLVAGSYLFRSHHMGESLAALRTSRE